MGLTKEQLHKRITDKIIEYVINNGTKISKTMTSWNTYPVCVQDICVLNVVVKENSKKEKKLVFGDIIENKFDERRSSSDVERKYLEEVFEDMKITDIKHKKYYGK